MLQSIIKATMTLLLATVLLLSLMSPSLSRSSITNARAPSSDSPQKDEPPPRGRFRVTLLGFHVNQETWDDALERDGKRDEVFILAQSYVYASGAKLLAKSGLIRTRVMGDPTGRPDRITAGSTPANVGLFGIGRSIDGGLRTGDSFPSAADLLGPPHFIYPDRPPMILWEGELVGRNASNQYEQNVALIVLTIWEWDGPGQEAESSAPEPKIDVNAMNFFLARTITLPAGTVFGPPPRPCPECPRVPSPPPQPTPQRIDYSTLTVRDNDPFTVRLINSGIGSNVRIDDNMFGDPRNRPIGMAHVGRHYEFEPLALVLNYNLANDANLVEIRYRDAEELKGDYTLFVRVERLPSS